MLEKLNEEINKVKKMMGLLLESIPFTGNTFIYDNKKYQIENLPKPIEKIHPKEGNIEFKFKDLVEPLKIPQNFDIDINARPFETKYGEFYIKISKNF